MAGCGEFVLQLPAWRYSPRKYCSASGALGMRSFSASHWICAAWRYATLPKGTASVTVPAYPKLHVVALPVLQAAIHSWWCPTEAGMDGAVTR
jgi:hypothetical protein